MCAFGEADHALAAACTIQESLRQDGQWALNVRAGMHSGQTSAENHHPFGNTVNVSARVVGLAKAGQIMLADHTYKRLNDANKDRTRRFTRVYIKGKGEPYTIHQALWAQADGTVTVTVTSSISQYIEQRRSANCAKLRYRENQIDLTEGAEFPIGRGMQCHCRVVSTTASRIHATVKCREGKLLLADSSTNGTFI
jgi:adenylate cyclase